MNALLTNALDKDNNLVHVDDVANGNACACHCPKCGVPLCAKNRSKEGPGRRIHHFAHARGYIKCEGASETVLHMLVKEALMEAGQIMLPTSDNCGFPSGLVKIGNIEMEKWDEQFRIRPDVEGILDDGRRLIIEFRVSHKVDENKRLIIINNHLLCLEIDVNFQAVDKELLKGFLIGSSRDREWIVRRPMKPKKDTEYHTYVPNPLYDYVRCKIKERCEKESELLIHALFFGFLNLKEKGYELCGVNGKVLGFKTDLHFRSSLLANTDISLNIRGRRRSASFKHPNNLIIIDIVLKRCTTIYDIEQIWEDGIIEDSNFVMIYCNDIGLQ